MDKTTALARLRRGDERALEWFVARYTPYVGAIVWNIVGGRLTVQDGRRSRRTCSWSFGAAG